MAPRFIRPYVKNDKNDARDAEAICEAVTRPTMRFVPINGVWAYRLRAKRGTYIAAVAIANKNARVMWALLTRGESYSETPAHHPQSSNS